MSTAKQHSDLLIEILAEMTPEQLAATLKPVDLAAGMRLSFEAEPAKSALSPFSFVERYRIAAGFHVPSVIIALAP